MLLLASCIFYMFFKPEYILILAFTIFIDYYAGILIFNEQDYKKKKIYLSFSIITNLGILIIFKYYNFINENITGLFSLFSVKNNIPFINFLLPIGLSFHTFQAMSYNIEIYRGKQLPETKFGIYALYVMFYPQLVAGPIERPQNLIHQFKEDFRFNSQYLLEGIRLILFGLFKKVVIADRLAIYVDTIFDHPEQYNYLNVLIGVVFFAIQIYADFSGYSDIAIGTAKTMGFDLMINFNRPFFSKSITEYWRRWHVSLTTWFNDYLFSPIAINKRNWGTNGVLYAILVTFLLSGLWHGASWTFILFGLINGLGVAFELVTRKQRRMVSKIIPYPFYNFVCILLTFSFACFTFIFFRSNKMSDVFTIMKYIFSFDSSNSFQLILKDISGAIKFSKSSLSISLLLIVILFSFEYKTSPKLFEFNNTKIKDYILITSLILAILFLGVFQSNSFIYFQF